MKTLAIIVLVGTFISRIEPLLIVGAFCFAAFLMVRWSCGFGGKSEKCEKCARNGCHR